VKSIEGFNTAPREKIDGRLVDGFTLTEEIYVTRGEIMSHAERGPLLSTRLRSNVIWLGRSRSSPAATTSSSSARRRCRCASTRSSR